jgi:hypothetical protein
LTSMPALPPALPRNRAGVVVSLNGEWRFLAAELVRRFVPPPQLSDVAGTGLTMGLVDGQVLAILAIGARGSALTVCEVGGELVGLLGADPRAVGFFDADGSGVRFRGERASALDVAELVRAAARRSTVLEVPA